MIYIDNTEDRQSVRIPHNGRDFNPDGLSLELHNVVNNTDDELLQYASRVSATLDGDYVKITFGLGANPLVVGEYQYKLISTPLMSLTEVEIGSGLAVFGDYHPERTEYNKTIEYEQY